MRRELKPIGGHLMKLGAVVLCALGLFAAGCSDKPTFTGDQAVSSVEKISKDVHGLTVTGDMKGGTLGVLWTNETLLDATGKTISKSVNEIIGNLSSNVSRVALSIDRPIDFVVVAVRGIKEEMELRVVRRVDDIRRAQAEALSVTESMNRTLFIQSQFEPGKSKGVPFNTEDWALDNFLARQILQRVRMAKTPDPENPMPTELYDGKYFKEGGSGKRVFEFSILTFKQENSKDNILTVLRTVRDVIMAYHYEDFDQIVIRDLIHNRRLVIGKNTLKIFDAKQISEEDLIKTRLVSDTGHPSAFKNALEVFGFNVS